MKQPTEKADNVRRLRERKQAEREKRKPVPTKKPAKVKP